MDGTRFDDLARALGIGATRRGALGLLASLTGLRSSDGATKRHEHGKPTVRRQVRAEATCRRNGSACNTSAQCCSRKCEGKNGRKKCKSCAVKSCSAKADVCRGGALCACQGNPDCACWIGIDGDPLCASLPYGACFQCDADSVCETLFGIPGSRCVKADSRTCDCIWERNPEGTACVAPCGQRCAPVGVKCREHHDCCSGKCGCGSGGCFCREAQCSKGDQPRCHSTDYSLDCCENECVGEDGGGLCIGGVCSGPGAPCGLSVECCSRICQHNGTRSVCCQPSRAICGGDKNCCTDGSYPQRCLNGFCCVAPSEPCTSDGECCTGRCISGRCVTNPGDPCNDHHQCGLGVVAATCIDGVCKVSLGQPCRSDAMCAGDVCRDDVCCQRLRSYCAGSDRECCAGEGICGRRAYPPGGSLNACCRPPGDACEAKEDCCSPSRACEGGRCCTPLGARCNAESVCCDGLCVAGRGACCHGEGESCTTSGDCCGSLRCDLATALCRV